MAESGKVLPFIVPSAGPASEAVLVAQEFLKVSSVVDGVVVLYQTQDGHVNILTDQGDPAGALYFIEQAKLRILTRGTTIPQSVG